jgi:hypothetical protein
MFTAVAYIQCIETKCQVDYCSVYDPYSVINTIEFSFIISRGLISKQFNKTTDPEFQRKIDNFNLLFLVETHLEPDHDISKIGSYYCNLIDIKMFTAVAYIQCIETKCQVDYCSVYDPYSVINTIEFSFIISI